MAAYHTGSDPIEIGDLGSKVKVTQYPFFLHNSLSTSLSVNCSRNTGSTQEKVRVGFGLNKNSAKFVFLRRREL